MWHARRVSAEGFFRGVHRFVIGFRLLQLAVIGAFVTVGPWLALRGGLAGAALLLAGLGLLFDWRALDVLLGWLPARGQRVVVRASAAAHFAALAGAGWCLIQPIDPAWSMLEGTDAWSDPRLVYRTEGELVVLSGGPGRARRWDGEGWEDLGGPDFFAWEFHAGPGGSLWSAPSGVDRIDFLDAREGAWRAFGRGGQALGSMAVGVGELLAAVDGELLRCDMAERTCTKVTEVQGNVRSVALAPDGSGLALAIGPRGWWERRDGSWDEVESPGPEVGWPEAFVGGGGWRYAMAGGVWSGALHVAPPGRGFAPVEVPVPDLRTLVADPREGARVVVGSWGQGVWASEDGGGTWSELGLRQIQVRSVAIDWSRGTVCAGSSNLLFSRGVFCRDWGGQSSGLQAGAP